MMNDIINTVKEKIHGMSPKQKRILLGLVILVVILTTILLFSSEGVNGEYSFYRIECDDEGYNINEPGYFNITGVGKRKEIELYLDLYGDTVTILGVASPLYETDTYIKYRLTVDDQSGTLFVKELDYLNFYYYPDRGDNGIIKVDGQGTILFYEKNK